MSWSQGLFDCFSPFDACLLSTFIPCMLYGRISSRSKDLHDDDACNGACCGFCCLQSFTGCGWIMVMMKRGELRERYGIQGDGCSDCMATFCCTCCAMVQVDAELKNRAQTGPVATGYQQQAGMVMPPQGMHMQNGGKPQY